MLDFRITTFLTVCKFMNYTKAAQYLNITQPAVSQHIKYLESEYHVRLFYLDGKKLCLTESGRILYKKMELLRNDESKLKKALNESDFMSQDIAFGVTMTIGEYEVAAPISAFIKKNPDINLKVCFGNTAELLQALENGSIDFALVEGYFPINEYDWLVYKTVDFIPVCSSSHVFENELLFIKDLFDQRIIIREPGSGTRNVLERFLAVQGYSIADFKSSLQVENMHLVIRLLSYDCGITFLYKSAVEKELSSGSLRELRLDDFSIRHDFTFIWQKNSIFSEEIRRKCCEIFMQ